MNLSPRVRKLGAAALSLAIFVVLAMALRSPESWSAPGRGEADNVAELTTALFSTHVVALEVLGILLTAAMIGALVIARPLGAVEDKAHYGQVSEQDLARTMHVSDLDATTASFQRSSPPAAPPAPAAPAPEPKEGS